MDCLDTGCTVLYIYNWLFGPPGGTLRCGHKNQHLLRHSEGEGWGGRGCRTHILPGSQGGPKGAGFWTQGHLHGEMRSISWAEHAHLLHDCVDPETANRTEMFCLSVDRLSLKQPVRCNKCHINTLCCSTECVSTTRRVSVESCGCGCVWGSCAVAKVFDTGLFVS